MAKPEWGTKRACPSCGARFYDLQRSPVPCPKCGAEFDPGQGQRSRRPKAPPPEEPPIAASGQTNGADDGDTDVGNAPVEDTSELGADEDDVSAVRGRAAPDKASD